VRDGAVVRAGDAVRALDALLEGRHQRAPAETMERP
jgi:hypothetical protein